MLYHIISYYIVLYFTIRIILHYIMLYYITLYYIIFYYWYTYIHVHTLHMYIYIRVWYCYTSILVIVDSSLTASGWQGFIRLIVGKPVPQGSSPAIAWRLPCVAIRQHKMLHTYIYIHIFNHTYIRMRIHIHTNKHMYIYIYICIHIVIDILYTSKASIFYIYLKSFKEAKMLLTYFKAYVWQPDAGQELGRCCSCACFCSWCCCCFFFCFFFFFFFAYFNFLFFCFLFLFSLGPILSLSWAHVRPMLAYVGPILALCWPYVGQCSPYLGPCWPYLGPCWSCLRPVLALCWPIWPWAYVGASLAVFWAIYVETPSRCQLCRFFPLPGAQNHVKTTVFAHRQHKIRDRRRARNTVKHEVLEHRTQNTPQITGSSVDTGKVGSGSVAGGAAL